MDAAVIMNPASSSGRAAAVQGVVVTLAARDGVRVHLSQSPGHARDLARSLASSGCARVIAVGGDGTASEVANGLAHTGTALAVVPAGTGNDWVRTIDVPLETRKAWRVATEGRIASTDLAEVEGQGYCLNVLGAGFDAEVARRIATARGLLARLGPTPRYIAAVLGTVRGYRRSTVRMSIDGGTLLEVPETLLIAVGVARYYGSGMKILPAAEIDDGLLDVVWGGGIRSVELPSLLRSVYKGTHSANKKVETARCRSIRLESDTPTPFHIDGDVRGELPISVRVAPAALKIVVP